MTKKLLDLKREQERLEALKKEAEEKKLIDEEIQRLEGNIERKELEIKQAKSFIRGRAILRDQHLLDEYQEDAKRSHIYDGIPVLIEGGPGTGKTTTVIQRLKFLTSKQALEDYNEKLTKDQVEKLTKENNSSWMFLSPTKLLLQYLRQNMQNEGLTTNDNNSLVLSDFREKMFREYGLWNPEKDGPFKKYKHKAGESSLIVDPENTIKAFEKYCIQEISKNLKYTSKLETKVYSWHNTAIRIKSYCAKSSDIKTISVLLDLFYSLQSDNEIGSKAMESDLSDKVKQAAVRIEKSIVSDLETVEKLQILFEKWRKERMATVEDDDLDEDEQTTYINMDFETELFDKLRSLIRRLALREIDNTFKLSKKQNALYEIIQSFLSDIPTFAQISELAWFSKKFAFLCRGIESNVINQIPRLYKSFRKDLLTNEEQQLYKKKLLKKVIEKDNNKHLHMDEQNLLLGFINNLLLGVYKRSKERFNSLNHSYVLAYKEFVKPVLVIDEATDYTQLDYYMIYSYRHYEFSAVTLSGDIMQGLNKSGIESWGDLDWIIPNLERKELKISYRQLPTLLQMAKEMYKEDQGFYPEYDSLIRDSINDPKPLAFISDDEDEKVKWISYLIQDVYRAYSNKMPSVAVFVGDDENIDELIERFEDLDLLNGISIMNCSGGRLLEREDTVRVFNLQEVKGMEFEVVFFHNIDKAIEDRDSEKLLRRYLYVGISRATTHLAATFNNEDGYENIIRYFEREGNW